MICPIKATSRLIDFIEVKNNFFSDELCDQIIQEYEDDPLWSKSLVSDGEKNTDVRHSQQIFLSSDEVQKDSTHRKELDKIICDKISKALTKYIHESNVWIQCEYDTGYILLKYTKGDYYKEHTDQGADERKLTFIVQLNEEFTGGGLSFFNDTYRIKPKKGSLVIFPSSFLYPHQAVEVTEGVRYSLTTWIC